MAAERTCAVAMYHYIRDTADTPFPTLNALSLADFDAQVAFLGETRRLIGFDEFEAGLGGAVLPDETALLTFDDGVRDHLEILPRLVARGIRGAFFVSGDTLGSQPRMLNVHKVHVLVARLGADTLLERLIRALPAEHVPEKAAEPAAPELYRYDGLAARTVKRLLNYVLPMDVAAGVLSELFEAEFGSESAFARGFYLSEADIVSMSRAGQTFGFHTDTHPVLSRLSRDDQRRELERGPALIRDLTGQAHVPFCVPHGHLSSYNRDTVALLAELGYAASFTVVREVARFGTASRFEVPRLDTKDMPPFADVAGLRGAAAVP